MVSRFLRRAIELSSGRSSEASVLYDLARDEISLWLIFVEGEPKAAATARVQDYPGKRVLTVELIGGTGMKDWLDDIVSTTADHARAMNCDGMDILGRDGWERVLAKYGGRKVATVMELDL